MTVLKNSTVFLFPCRYSGSFHLIFNFFIIFACPKNIDIEKGQGKAMNHFEKVFQCFPPSIQCQINSMDRYTREAIEEVRVYKGKEIQVFAAGKRLSLSGKIEGNDISNLLNNLMKFSYYAYEDDLAKGFITIDGGHRVGICGKAVVEKGRVTLIREVSSLNIRYSKEVIGCSDSLTHLLINSDRSLNSMLIVSPPGCGKTTLLRDIGRNISMKGYKVGICDERSEIAGMYNGCSSYHFGTMVDVLDGCPKAEGMLMMIRAMSPQVIITDEVGKKEDVAAIKACANSGVRVITSVHGSDVNDLKNSEIYETIERKDFQIIVFLTDKPTVGTVREVLRG